MSDTTFGRWSTTRAHAWWRAQPWICGFNYLPSSAVNFLEMWRRETFDAEAIARELGWAAALGYNAIRVNPHFLVWRHDRAGHFERLGRVLDIAAPLGILVVPCPLDDCGFGNVEPVYGPQPDPVPGVHNSRAVASPGRVRVLDRRQWPEIERYLGETIAHFGDDPRVLFWDLYNEPGNRMIFTAEGFREADPALEAASRELMARCFAQARIVDPDQPLSVGAWVTPLPDDPGPPYRNEIDRQALALSDIVTFHAYASRERVAGFIDHLAALGRPMFCTEWMARGVDSRITDQLALFRERGVGCFQWGFVRGRSQTHLAWPDELMRLLGIESTSDTWFHDLVDEQGRPHDASEIELLRRITGRETTGDG